MSLGDPPGPRHSSGCDAADAGSGSFWDRDGDTEKQKQKGSERGGARTRINSSQASSGRPPPACSWVDSRDRGKSRPCPICFAVLWRSLGAPRFMASGWGRGCRGQVGSILKNPPESQKRSSPGRALGVGVWALPSATPEGLISLAANLEEEKGKVSLLSGRYESSPARRFMSHVTRGYQGLFQG